MLRWYLERYDDRRERIDGDIAFMLLSESLKISGYKIDVDKAREVLLLFFSSLSYYFHIHPTEYADFGKFAIYRSTEPHKLLTVESMHGYTASEIYNYYKEGGLNIEAIEGMVTTFVKGLSSHAQYAEAETNERINRIKSLAKKREEQNKI